MAPPPPCFRFALRAGRFVSITVFVVAAFATVAPGSAAAQCSPRWNGGYPVQGVDGEIDAVVVWDADGAGPALPMLVVGGGFEAAGSAVTHNIAAFDGQSWRAMDAGVTCDRVWALHVLDGRLFAGGQFRRADDTYFAVAEWLGDHWEPLGDGVNGVAFALGSYQGALVAGGQLWGSGGVEFRNLARWTGAAWESMGGDIGEYDSDQVYALREFQGDLYIGGQFGVAGGVATENLARWNGQAWSQVGGGANYFVSALGEFDNKLIVGGGFNYVGAVNAGKIAAWDGQSWSTLANGVGRSDSITGFGAPYAMTVYQNRLYVGGSFESYDSGHGRRIASWDGTTWRALGEGCDSNVNGLAVFGGELIASGAFSTMDRRTVGGLAAWNGAAWRAVGDPRYALLSAITMHNGVPHAAGQFVDAAGATHQGAAYWNGSTWIAIPGEFNFGTTGFAGFYAATSHNGRLYVGGFFDTVAGQQIVNVASWDGLQWRPLGVGTDSSVTALLSHPSGLIVGGNFVSAGGIYAPRIARWTGATWQSMTGNLDGFNNIVECLTLFQGQIVAGGNFVGFVNNQYLNRIARWDGSTWQPLRTGIIGGGFSTDVYAMAALDSTLYVGGRFANADGLSVQNLASWNGSDWRREAIADDWVRGMCVHQGDLLACGLFQSLGGQAARGVARLAESGWEPLGGGIAVLNGANGPERVLSAGDQLLVAGRFSVVNGQAFSNFAFYGSPNCPGDLDCDQSVTLTDLATLLIHFGTPSGAARADGDVDGDGDVDLIDLATLLSAFGSSC